MSEQGREILDFLTREAEKGRRGSSARMPSNGGAGTHPMLYALYLEYVATGAYPYLDSVQRWITERVDELPRFDTSTSGHTQPDPIQRQLQTEMYVASCMVRYEQEQERIAALAAEGFAPLDVKAIEPDATYLLARGTDYVGVGVALKDPVKVRPVFQDGELRGFLPPRKRTHGFGVSKLDYVKAVA